MGNLADFAATYATSPRVNRRARTKGLYALPSLQLRAILIVQG
jgi:hypothetical protein